MGRYTKWTTAIKDVHLTIHEVAVIIPFLTIPQRKVILTQARCQVLPEASTILFIRHRKTFLSFIDYSTRKPPSFAPARLLQFAMHLEYFMNPVFSGLLSVLLRCAPHEHEGPIIDEIASGKMKEVTAAITPFRGPNFDYRCILSHVKADRKHPLTPLFNDIPDRSSVCEDTYMALTRSKVHPIKLKRKSAKFLPEKAFPSTLLPKNFEEGNGPDGTEEYGGRYKRLAPLREGGCWALGCGEVL